MDSANRWLAFEPLQRGRYCYIEHFSLSTAQHGFLNALFRFQLNWVAQSIDRLLKSAAQAGT